MFIIFYFLSTISFSLQLHLKKPWVRGKSLRGFSLAAMTALLMSCSPALDVVDRFGGWHKDSLEVITKLGWHTEKEEEEIMR